MNEFSIVCKGCGLILCREIDIDRENSQFYATIESNLPYYKVNFENNAIHCIACNRVLGSMINNIVLMQKSATVKGIIDPNDVMIIGDRLRMLRRH